MDMAIKLRAFMREWISTNTIDRTSRVVAWGGAFYPILRLVYLGFEDALTANPVEYVTRQLGTWALIFLCITLSMSPLRQLTKSPLWIRRRRFLGLASFVYASLHFMAWAWLDKAWVLDQMIKDVLKRPYLSFGAVALLALVPLALTSTKAMIKRLGPRWKTLHKLVYLIIVLGVIHLYFHKAGKHDFAKVWTYGSIVTGLLGYRLLTFTKKVTEEKMR